MDQHGHETIMERLGEIKGGIDGINRHLATLNGSVAKAAGEIVALKLEDANIKKDIERLQSDYNEDSDTKKTRSTIWYGKAVDMGMGALIAVLAVVGTLYLKSQVPQVTASGDSSWTVSASVEK